MTAESDRRMQLQSQENDVSAAQRIEEYARQVQQKLAEAAARADAAEAELRWMALELDRSRALVEGMPDALSRLISHLHDGWSECEVKLVEALSERDEARRAARAATNEMHATREAARAEVKAVRVRSACDLAAIRGEIVQLDRELVVLFHVAALLDCQAGDAERVPPGAQLLGGGAAGSDHCVGAAGEADAHAVVSAGGGVLKEPQRPRGA